MKKLIYLFVLTLVIASCSSDDENENTKYKFIKEFSTTVTVGGVVGTSERTFDIGEIYSATAQSANAITIRIAERSKLNDDCSNSWCYQELLDVPREFLQLLE